MHACIFFSCSQIIFIVQTINFDLILIKNESASMFYHHSGVNLKYYLKEKLHGHFTFLVAFSLVCPPAILDLT